MITTLPAAPFCSLTNQQRPTYSSTWPSGQLVSTSRSCKLGFPLTKRMSAMKNNLHLLCKSLLLLLVSTASTLTTAHNKVVVIPMSGEDLKPLSNVISVSPANGDFTDPVAAINSISDAAFDNPYTIVIGPGLYELSEPLEMKSYVDIVGSGTNATVLQGSFSGTSATSVASAVVSGAPAASISDLAIVNNGGPESISIALAKPSGTVSNVRLEVRNGNTVYALYGNAVSPKLENLTIDVSNAAGNQYGIYLSSSRSQIIGPNISISGGLGVDYGMYLNAGDFLVDSADIRVQDGTQQRGIYLNTGGLVVGDSQILISDATIRQEAIYANAAATMQISNVNIAMDPRTGVSISQYGIFSNTSVDTTASNVNIEITDSAGSEYGVYSNTSSGAGSYSNLRIRANTLGFRVSSIASNDTYISNSVVIGAPNAVSGTRTFCNHVFIDPNADGANDGLLNSTCGN